MSNKVLVTGMGAVCSLGNNIETIYENAKNGVCGIDYAQGFDTSKITNVHFAAEVKDFDPSKYIKKREAKRLDRFSQFAIYAACQAWEDVGLTEFDPYRVGCIIGSGMGGMKTICEQNETLVSNGPSTVSPLFIPKSIINLAAGNIAIKFGLNGPNYGVVTACSSGTDAIGQAYLAVKEGRLDAVLVGGAEAVICDLAVAGFNQMQALSNADRVDRASIPFDKDRNGFVMGEGSGFIVIEKEDIAIKRKAKIYGEIAGYGQTCDANHITAPKEDGSHASKAMELAISEAGIDKNQVCYINAHGTGTQLNDKMETKAIKKCFGEHSYDILVSSTKSMTAHMLGAAGAIECILTMLSMNDNIALPTINLQCPDEECDLNYVPNKAKGLDTEYALTNSFGFGGHNSSLLLKKHS